MRIKPLWEKHRLARHLHNLVMLRQAESRTVSKPDGKLRTIYKIHRGGGQYEIAEQRGALIVKLDYQEWDAAAPPMPLASTREYCWPLVTRADDGSLTVTGLEAGKYVAVAEELIRDAGWPAIVAACRPFVLLPAEPSWESKRDGNRDFVVEVSTQSRVAK